jgi:hypothetical protein
MTNGASPVHTKPVGTQTQNQSQPKGKGEAQKPGNPSEQGN